MILPANSGHEKKDMPQKAHVVKVASRISSRQIPSEIQLINNAHPTLD